MGGSLPPTFDPPAGRRHASSTFPRDYPWPPELDRKLGTAFEPQRVAYSLLSLETVAKGK